MNFWPEPFSMVWFLSNFDRQKRVKLLYYFFATSFLCARLNYDRSFLHAVHVFFFLLFYFLPWAIDPCTYFFRHLPSYHNCLRLPVYSSFSPYRSAVVSEKCVVTPSFLFGISSPWYDLLVSHSHYLGKNTSH